MSDLKIIYEDNHSIAVIKPGGLLVQATEKGVPNLLDEVRKYIKDKYQKPGNVFLGLVHRLDRAVSGIVVFAKTTKGASRLSEQFRNREVGKIYTALVEGHLNNDSGHLVHYLLKDETKKHALISEEEKDGYQRSELKYVKLKEIGDNTLIEIDLLTGRFNQIRAQLAHIGHPIVGDIKYGAKVRLDDNTICLCATKLSFNQVISGEEINLKIDFPKSWLR